MNATFYSMLRFLCALCLLVSATACAPDAPEAEELLPGRWELTEALRDNMKTPMLDGLFYNFDAGGQLETNLMGNESPGSYRLEEGWINTEGIIPPLNYYITEISDSSLQLRTELQGFRFDFVLRRK